MKTKLYTLTPCLPLFLSLPTTQSRNSPLGYCKDCRLLANILIDNGSYKISHDTCFDICRPMLAMIDHSRFEAEISQPSPSIQVQALSYALGALGAFLIPELHSHVKICYQQSRTLLDLCERQESGESLISINTLQACTLLTFYELKQPNVGRAWMSLGRAIRLAKMMGLDQVDGQLGMAAQWCPSTQPLPLFDPAEAEERRRTFWILYILDAFANTSAKSDMAFNDQVCPATKYSPMLRSDEIYSYVSLYQVRKSKLKISSKQVIQ